MLAYSIPTTPAPSTVIVFGMRGSCRIVSESNTVSPSNGTSSGRFGREPVAMTKKSAVSVRMLAAARRLHRHGVGAGEAGVALDDLDRVAPERLVDQLELALHDRALAVHEVGHRELGADLVADAVEAVAGELVEEDRALAQRLRGDRAPVDAVAAHHVGALDDRHGLARAGRLDRRPLARRAAAQDHRRRSAPSASAESAILTGTSGGQGGLGAAARSRVAAPAR